MNFCSRAAIVAREAMAGTGVRAVAYVFLPVPKQFWRSSELNLAWASRAELDAVRSARKGGVVTRLYDPPNVDAAGEVVIHAAPGADPPQVLADLLDLFAPRWPTRAEVRPRIAVCTHGTRDRCCAKWGFAAYREARRLYESGGSVFEPLECSHLGGDRFAATGIVFPSGSMYAHLDQADLAGLLAGESMGRIAAERYRGRVFDPALVQIVRAGLARDGLVNDATAPIEVTRDDGDRDRAQARIGAARFEVALATAEVSFFGNCEDLDEGRASRARRTVYAGARPSPAPAARATAPDRGQDLGGSPSRSTPDL